mmetsp:Transcript_11830/g.32763  ORF Transcript_11830/g.32763 Transcript_11830/m.32763 type:complete len:696 (-) Transcript_11830:422-2509(-)
MSPQPLPAACLAFAVHEVPAKPPVHLLSAWCAVAQVPHRAAVRAEVYLPLPPFVPSRGHARLHTRLEASHVVHLRARVPRVAAVLALKSHADKHTLDRLRCVVVALQVPEDGLELGAGGELVGDPRLYLVKARRRPFSGDRVVVDRVFSAGFVHKAEPIVHGCDAGSLLGEVARRHRGLGGCAGLALLLVRPVLLAPHLEVKLETLRVVRSFAAGVARRRLVLLVGDTVGGIRHGHQRRIQLHDRDRRRVGGNPGQVRGPLPSPPLRRRRSNRTRLVVGRRFVRVIRAGVVRALPRLPREIHALHVSVVVLDHVLPRPRVPRVHHAGVVPTLRGPKDANPRADFAFRVLASSPGGVVELARAAREDVREVERVVPAERRHHRAVANLSILRVRVVAPGLNSDLCRWLGDSSGPARSFVVGDEVGDEVEHGSRTRRRGCLVVGPHHDIHTRGRPPHLRPGVRLQLPNRGAALADDASHVSAGVDVALPPLGAELLPPAKVLHARGTDVVVVVVVVVVHRRGLIDPEIIPALSDVVPRVGRPPRRGDARNPSRLVQVPRPVVQVRRGQRPRAEGDGVAPVRLARERIDDEPRVALGGELRERDDRSVVVADQLRSFHGAGVDAEVHEEPLHVVGFRVGRVAVYHHASPLQRGVAAPGVGAGAPRAPRPALLAPGPRRRLQPDRLASRADQLGGPRRV